MVGEEVFLSSVQTYGFPAVLIYMVFRLEGTLKEHTAAITGLMVAIATCPKKKKQ